MRKIFCDNCGVEIHDHIDAEIPAGAISFNSRNWNIFIKLTPEFDLDLKEGEFPPDICPTCISKNLFGVK